MESLGFLNLTSEEPVPSSQTPPSSLSTQPPSLNSQTRNNNAHEPPKFGHPNGTCAQQPHQQHSTTTSGDQCNSTAAASASCSTYSYGAAKCNSSGTSNSRAHQQPYSRIQSSECAATRAPPLRPVLSLAEEGQQQHMHHNESEPLERRSRAAGAPNSYMAHPPAQAHQPSAQQPPPPPDALLLPCPVHGASGIRHIYKLFDPVHVRMLRITAAHGLDEAALDAVYALQEQVRAEERLAPLDDCSFERRSSSLGMSKQRQVLECLEHLRALAPLRLVRALSFEHLPLSRMLLLPSCHLSTCSLRLFPSVPLSE